MRYNTWVKTTVHTLLAFTLLLTSTHCLFGQGTAFTYQGRLNEGDHAATGTYDFQFTLYDALADGSQVASPVNVLGIRVTNGIFTATLDFGNVFNGADRWLSVGVRANGTGAFTILSPRQPLSPSPYSVYAAKSGTAAVATTANNIGSLSSTNIMQLSVLGTTARATGVPMVTDGFITRATVTYGGIGYVSPPLVTVTDPWGSNAVITAAVSNGSVVGFTVLNAGYGYSPFPTLTVELPPSNAYQTLTAMNYFTGINTMTNPNNAFAGTFSGTFNGKGVLPWQTVSGASLQAQPNTGYLLTNSSTVTVTLPLAPIPGDILRISGAGAGGWRIAQNAGQSILAGNLSGWSVWKSRGPVQAWTAITCSSDGTKLAATTSPGLIYTSSDAGATWTPQPASPSTNWGCIASSADGIKLVGAVGGNDWVWASSGYIYTSTNSGATWIQRGSNQYWSSVASSADGAKLVASAGYSDLTGYIYTSTDSGATWLPRASLQTWRCVASSVDGNKLVAGTAGGQIYTSTDSGGTWTPRFIINNLSCVASSADGTRLTAAGVSGVPIYTSSDSGATWVPQNTLAGWLSISSSADGMKLIGAGFGGTVLTSSDSGIMWTAQGVLGGYMFSSTTCSADGTKLFLVASGGPISIYAPQSTSGTAGYLLGGPGAAIELQYIGRSQFLPLSSAGTVLAY